MKQGPIWTVQMHFVDYNLGVHQNSKIPSYVRSVCLRTCLPLYVSSSNLSQSERSISDLHILPHDTSEVERLNLYMTKSSLTEDSISTPMSRFPQIRVSPMWPAASQFGWRKSQNSSPPNAMVSIIKDFMSVSRHSSRECQTLQVGDMKGK